MKFLLTCLICLISCKTIFAQEKFFTKSGKIIFDATSPKSPENIDGVNKTVTCVLDTKSGNLQFAVLMKGFEFEKALMQEHFNENYVESNKYPKAEFRGTIETGINELKKNGVSPVKVKGKLSIHGLTKDVEATGKISEKNGKIEVQSNFEVLLKDFGVEVPQLVADKVSKVAKITVDCLLEPLK